MGMRPDGIEGVARIVARLPHLRELAVGINQPGSLGELIALARQRNLEKVCAVGLFSFAFTLATGVLEISFDGRLDPKHPAFVAAALSSARAVGTQRVVVRMPPRAKLELNADGRPKTIRRRTEAIELASILAAAESMGLACEFTS